jgi:hypothetical protein
MDAAKTALIVLSLACGCICSGDDNPAPGCGDRLPFAMGGCQGKSVIKDLNVTSGPDCLRLSANNCNGGIIAADNRCPGNVTVGGLTLAPGRDSFELARDKDGNAYAKHAGGNFASYLPDDDDALTVDCSADGKPFAMSYVKSKPLC